MSILNDISYLKKKKISRKFLEGTVTLFFIINMVEQYYFVIIEK